MAPMSTPESMMALRIWPWRLQPVAMRIVDFSRGMEAERNTNPLTGVAEEVARKALRHAHGNDAFGDHTPLRGEVLANVRLIRERGSNRLSLLPCTHLLLSAHFFRASYCS